MQFQQMAQQAQQMQKRMKEMQEGLADKTVKGTAGAGDMLVEVEATCNGKILSLDIKADELLNKENKEMLEDLIIAAIHNAKENADQESNKQMEELASSMGIPLNILQDMF